MPQRPGLFPDDDVLAQPPEIPTRGGALFPDAAPDPLAQTYGEALKQPPDQAGRIFNLRLKTGLPPAVIERNLEAVEREVAQQGFDPARLRRESPLLARWLEEHPELAAIAQDDLAPLSALERTLQIGTRAVRALTTGPMAMSAGAWGVVRAGAEWVGAEELSAFARGSAAVADHLRTRLRGDRAGAGGFESSVYGGLESLSLTATALPAAVVGGPAGVIAVLGGVTAGESFTQAREKGRGLGTATLFALGQGVIEAATEFIPARWFLADLATNATFWRALKHQAFAEVPGEQIATVLQDLNEWAVLRPEAPFMDYLRERPSAAGETLVATIVAVGGQGALIRGLERMSGTSATAQVVEQLHESAAASKTRERAPEALRAFLELATKEGLTHVYTPASTFTEYFQQQGEDPEARAAELTGDPDALRLARATTNGDLAIPTATYLSRIVGSGHEQFFAQELRLSPDMQNARETREALAAEAERVVTTPELDPTAPARQQIYDAMVGKLTATNRYMPREVDVLARLYETVFGALAGRRRVDPFALFQRYEPTLVAEGRPSDTAVSIETGGGPGGIPASVARAGETPGQREARRAGHLEALTTILTREAHQLDPNVDPAVIREELDRRLALHEEGQATTRESGAGQDLLRAIAGAGGVWWERRSGAFKGEIEDLIEEGRDIRGTRGGRVLHVRGRATYRGVPGVFNEQGLTPDGMVEALRQDPRFQHITDINELLTAIDEAMQSEPDVDTLPGTAELRELGIVPGTRWWTDEEVFAAEARYGPLQQPAPEPNERGETAYFIGWQESGEADLPAIPLYNVLGGERSGSTLSPAELDTLGIPHFPPLEGDVSFNVEEFEQRALPPSAPRAARRAWLERRIQEARDAGREDLEALRLLQDVRDEEAGPPPAAAEETPVDPLKALRDRGELAQGTYGTFNPTTRTIRLLKNADRTTFIHESAHLFLEVMGDLAAAPDATAQLQGDMQTLFDQLFHFDGDLTAWRGLTQEQRRAHHETFARGFEKWLGEGKAPTPELQSLFARFSIWIRGAYTRLRRLNVELSPDVRAVMDRLVATDEAIALAEADAGVVALFTDAAAAGVPEAEFEGYRAQLQAASEQAQERLQVRLLAELEREEEAWWQDERETLRAQVAADVGERPVYRALAAMRGTRPDGSPLPEGTPATLLSKDFLVAQFGRSILRTLPRPVVYSVESGLPPDTVAQIFGYEHGEALIGAILAAPPMEEAIDALTDERMLEKHGDLLRDPDRLLNEAREAIAGEHREAVIRAELRMLNKLRGAAAPTVRAATVQQRAEQRAGERAGAERLRTEMPDQATLARLAKTQIAGMRLRDIRPDRFFAAARRHSRTATQAAAAQKFEAAVAAKQQELVNLALYREALAARQAVDDAREAFAKMFTPDAPLAKRRNMEYVQAARAIAATYFWPERRLESAVEALALVREHDPDLYDVLQEHIAAVRTAGTDLGALTFEAFQVMRETVDALWDQSRREQQMLVDGQLVDRNEAMAALEHRFDELGTPPRQEPRTEKGMMLLGIRAALRRVESWVDYVDGGDPSGPFRRFLWNPISEATAQYRIQRAEYLQKYLALVKSIETTLVPGTIAAPELTFTFESRAALLHAMLHTGNESNYQKLLRGYGWGALRADGTVDDTRWRAFRARLFREGVLTKADVDFLQAVWDLTEELKPAAQQVHRELYGHYFKQITAWPVDTPWGTLRGGYVPAIVDPLYEAEAAVKNEKQLLTEGPQNSFMFPTTGRGFTRAREEAYARPLALDLRLVPQHLDKVLRFIHIEPRVKDVGRLLLSHRFRDRLNAYDPAAKGDMLMPWLQRAASQRVTKASPGWAGRAVDAFFRTLRTRSGLNIMAANVINTLEQFTGLFTAGVKVKPRYLRNALWRYVRDHKRFVDEVLEADPFMRTRVTARVMETQRTIEDLLLNPSKYEQLREFGNVHGYFMQTMTQGTVDFIVWGGAYEQASEERNASHPEAVREAAAAVRQTQGSFAPEDLSRVEVAIPPVRAFLMFYGYFNMLANLNGTELGKVARDMGLRRGAGRALYIVTMGFVAQAVISEALRQALGGWEADDDEAWIDDAMWLFFGAIGRSITGMVPGGSAVTYTADKAVRALLPDRASRYEDRISTSPAISFLEGAGRAFYTLPNAVFGEGRARTAVRDTLDLVTLLTGVPFGAVKRPAGYLADVVEGREEPESALEATRGLVSGRSQAER